MSKWRSTRDRPAGRSLSSSAFARGAACWTLPKRTFVAASPNEYDFVLKLGTHFE